MRRTEESHDRDCEVCEGEALRLPLALRTYSRTHTLREPRLRYERWMFDMWRWHMGAGTWRERRL